MLIISEVGFKFFVMIVFVCLYLFIVYVCFVEGCIRILIFLCVSFVICEGVMGVCFFYIFMFFFLIVIICFLLLVDWDFCCKGNKLCDNILWLFVLSVFIVYIFKFLEGNFVMNWCSIFIGLMYWWVINLMVYCF